MNHIENRPKLINRKRPKLNKKTTAAACLMKLKAFKHSNSYQRCRLTTQKSHAQSVTTGRTQFFYGFFFGGQKIQLKNFTSLSNI